MTVLRVAGWILLLPAIGLGANVDVASDAELRAALADAKPGTTIRIAPGKYAGGVYASGLAGTAAQPIVIEGAHRNNWPVFDGGSEAIHLTDAAHVTLRRLIIQGQTGNGINIDDGGTYDSPSHHVTIEDVAFRDIGPKGNHDALKMSGVDDFQVRRCSFEGWAGQAVDMVGCHRGVVEGCWFRAKPGFDSTTGPQAKGGSSAIVIRKSTFAGPIQRGVNVGGSTGLKYFRPPDKPTFEAKDITVEACEFSDGVIAPIAFVGVDGAIARGNKIVRPTRFVFRILQETTEPGFVPCRNGVIEKNVIVFRRADVREPINIGPGTDAKSFRFAGNHWFCEDDPARSKPNLPSAETDGTYGVPPKTLP